MKISVLQRGRQQQGGIALLRLHRFLEGAKIFAEAVRRKVEVHPFVHGDVNIQVTVSVGGAVFTDEIESIQQMIESVDQKLYEAKNTGRNRVCF